MADTTGDQRSGGLGGLAKELPTERLRKEAQNLVTAFGERTLSSVTQLGKRGLKAGAGGKSPVKAGLGQVTEQVKEQVTERVKGQVKDQVKEKAKDKIKEAIPGLGGGNGGGGGGGVTDKKLKVTNIVEQIDVGVPVSLAYDLWTQFEDFPTYMKKVEDVEQESDTEMEWKAQIFWSHRKWRSEIIEQVPNKRIIWKSRADKGHVNGVVTFHEVTPDLTRILLVLQYYPQGFFEQTANLWRAQGRRARLELKHYRRHLMAEVLLNPDEIEGWHGVVHEGEVVDGDEDEYGEEENEDEEDEEEDEEEEEEEPEDEYGEEEYEEEEEEEDEEPQRAHR